MKKETSIFVLVVFAVFLVALFFSCEKESIEPQPPIYGRWEDITPMVDRLQYDIQDGGYFCRNNRAAFLTTWFCYTYYLSGDTIITTATPREKWLFKFHTDDVAYVTMIQDGKVQKLIFQRTK